MATCFEQHLKNVLSQEEKRNLASTARKEAAKYGLAEPDSLSYMNAAGQALEQLSVEELKITSGFSNNFKSPEGMQLHERTKLADHVKQSLPTFLNTGVDLFTFLTTKPANEIHARFAKFLEKDELTKQGQFTVNHFVNFVNKYAKESLNSIFFFNDDPKNNKYLGADLFSQLKYDEITANGYKHKTTTEAVKLAIAYAAYQALFDLESSTHYKTAKEMKAIHGNDPIRSFSAAQDALENKHLPAVTAINNWGQVAYSALGLSPLKGSSPNVAANLKAALGAQVYQVLRAKNLLRVESMDAATYHALFSDSEYKGTAKTKFFYTVETIQRKDKNNPEKTKELIDGALFARTQSGDVLNKVFTGQTSKKDILYTPTKDITTKTKTGMGVPLLMQKAQEAVQNNPIFAEPTQALLVTAMNENQGAELNFAQRLVGIKTQEQISAAHHTQRKGMIATNDSLQAGLDTLIKHYTDYTEAGAVLPVYLKMDVWQMLRAGTNGSAINPTGEKIHRYSMVGEKWATKVRVRGGTEADAELRDSFILRVAEGLGVETDKKSNEYSIGKAREILVNKDTFSLQIKAAIEAIQSGDNLERIVDAVDAVGLKGGERMKTFSALVAYAKYLTAFKNNDEFFEASLMGEVDGVSNGPMLTMLMLGLTVGNISMGEMFAKGGFYTDDNKDANVWLSNPDNLDMYKATSQYVLDAISNWALENLGSPLLDGLNYFSGKENEVTKAIELTTRKSIKEAVNPIMFGSAISNAVRGLFNKFIEDIYSKIAFVYNMPEEDVEAKSLAIAELNEKLVSLRLITEPQTIEHLHNKFEVTNQQYELLWNSYYVQKGTIGKAIYGALDTYFAPFLQTKTAITDTSNAAANNYIAAKQVLVDKAKADLGLSYTENAVNVGLPQETLDAIEKQLMDAGITPVMHSIWSQEEGNLEAGLVMLKRRKGQTNDDQYLTQVTGNQPFLTGNQGKHMAVRSKGPIEEGPGVNGTSVPTHSFDGYVSFKRMLELFKKDITSFNMHDSGGTSFAKLKELSIEFNKATFQGLIKYSPATSMAEMSVRNLEGMLTFEGNTVSTNDMLTHALQTVNLVQIAKDATLNKIDFLNTVKHVSQYALEGASYTVTNGDLGELRQQEEYEIARHQDLANRINAVIAELETRVEQESPKPEVKPTESINVWFGSNENAGLSNLAARKFTLDGKEYFSVEHAYQSWKSGSFDETTYKKYTGDGQKIIGKKTKTENNWNIRLMKRIMLESFKQNKEAKDLLLATGDAQITHTQDKGIWATEFPKLLMEVRAEIKPTENVDVTPEEEDTPDDVPPSQQPTEVKPKSELGKLLKELFQDRKLVPVGEFLTYITKTSEYPSFVQLAEILKDSSVPVQLVDDMSEVRADHRDEISDIAKYAGFYYDGAIYLNKLYLDGKLENKPPPAKVEQLLLHETIHSVISGWLLVDKNKETETYKNIQELYEIAKTAVTEQNKDFVAETENIDEFVTYALTRKSFQDFLNTLTISPDVKKVKKYYTSNVFLNFIQKVTEIFNSALKFTKDNKVNLSQTKTLNNVLLAVINQGAVLIDLAKKDQQSSNVARAMRLSNGLYTHRTMDVFDALNTGNTNTTNTNHLRSLLSMIVYKLHGPFGYLHAKYMKNTPIDEVGTYQAAYKAGDLPIATAIATASLPMSDAEAFAVDQVAIALEGGLNNPAMRKYRRVLELMYEQAQKELKPTDFSKGVYEFIFDTTNTNQQSLVRFAALGLANQQVIKAFKKVNVSLPDVKVKNTLFSRLQWLFTQVMNFVSSKATGVRLGVSLDQNLEHILKNLVASEAKYQAIASKPVTESALAKYSKEGMKQLGKGVTKIAKSQAVQNSSIKKVPVVGDVAAYMLKAVGTVADATINGRIEEHVEGAMKIRNALHDGPLGFRAGILNELRGETTIKSKFFRLLQLVKETEQKRETYIQQRSNTILDMFENKGQNLTKEQSKSITNLLRTGAGVVGFTGAQVKELLGDKAKLDKEIADTIARIKPIAKTHTNFIAGKAEATGAWLQTGVSQDPTRIAMNATMVIAMQGTPVEGKLDAQKEVLLPEVEKLIALFSLRHMNKAILKTVLDTEVDRGVDNGIDFVLRLHKTLHDEAKERLFKGKDILMQHGYLPEVINPNVDVKFVTATATKTLDENVAMYQKAGYVSYGLMTRDPAHTVPTVLLVNKNVPATRRLTALMAVIDDNTKGTLLHDGNKSGPFAKANEVMNRRLNKVTELNYAKWSKRGFAFDVDYENTLMVPLVNENEELVNARYMASTVFRDNILTRNNDFAYLLGKYEGTTYEKVTSKEQNKTIVQATKDLFDVNYAKNKRDYFYVGKNTPNKEYKEAYLLLPEATRQEIKRVWGDDGMFIRKDMLDLVFGYRKLNVGDAMLKSKAEQNLIIKGMSNLAEYIYAKNGSNDEKYAARLKAANFMKMLQQGAEETVSEVKRTIVMRLPLVLVGNETSNMSMLKLKGMGVFEALQEKSKALSALTVYRGQSEELDKLNTYLRTGTRINEHPTFIKRIAWLEESINKNPVKPLIDAGFMPTIVEDVETIAEDYSYKGELLNKIDAAANKFKPLKAVVGASNQMYMGEDTGLYQFMRYATQASDFTARYALYVHLSKDKTKPQSEIFKELSESFVPYDVPSHRMMEALNSVGLLMFTKFVLRIQKPLFEAIKENPSNAMLLWLFDYFFEGLTVITESSFVNRFYNPLNLGPLEFPFILDDIATVNALTSTVGGLTPE